VKNHFAAINPTDWKHVDFLVGPGKVVGCDAAGEVAAVGKSVKNFKVGDRVGNLLWGCHDSENAAFAQYYAALEKLSFKVPDNVHLKDASTLGIAYATSVQALYQSLGLPSFLHPQKSEKPIQVLIWSGSTSVGQVAIQLAKASGLEVITTASPKNFDHLKKLGAAHVFDYKDAEVSRKISEVAPELAHALDCISEGNSTKLIADALGPKGGKISLLLHVDTKDLRPEVKTQVTLAYTVMNKEVVFPGRPAIPANPKDQEVAAEYFAALEGLLKNKTLIPMPVKIFAGGLAGVSDAFDYMKSGKHSGEKLVVDVSETH